MNATTDGSDSQWELVEELVVEALMDRPINYVNLAAFAVLLFDYLITFDCEVRLSWGRKLSAARIICLLNRYFSLFLYLLSLVPLLPASDLIGCEVLEYMMQSSTAILYAIWAAFSGLRIYAISNNNRIVTLAVVSLALVPVGTNVYLATKISAVFVPVINCMATIDISEVTFDRLTVATRGSLMVSEAIVIVVTWMNTWNKGRSNLQMSSRMTFMALVLREGIMYFGVLLSLNVLQIIFTFVEIGTFSLVLQFTNVFTPIMITRFYFNLDELKAQEGMTTLPSARPTTLRFAVSTRSDDTFSVVSLDDDFTKDAPFEDGFPPPVPRKDWFGPRV